MKKAFIILLGICALSLPATTVFSQAGPGSSPQAGTITVLIDGFESDRGDAKAGLCNSRQEYEGDREMFRQAVLPIKGGKAEWVVKDLPWGIYAVKVYHDKNLNGFLDKNAMGVSKEAYGFSNNARGIFGPPDYEKVTFRFEETVMTVKITVK